MIKNKSTNWILDSGSDYHLCSDKSLLSNLTSVQKISIKTADGTILSANLAGTVLLGSILLKNVYLVKDLVANLISVQQLSKTYHVTFSPKGWTIAKDGQVVLKGSNANITPSSYFAPSSISLADAHRILGHIHSSSILMLASQNKLPFKLNSKTMPPCTSCILGKMDRSNKPTKALHRATKPGQRIVSDIWGPAPLPSHDNKRYFVHFTDEATGYVVKYNMEKKSEVLHHFRNFCNKMKTFAGFSIQCIRSDNGGEYLSNNFQNFCTNMGIHQEFTDNHSSFQNGLAERTNLTILNSVRTLLHGQSVSRKYWTEAADHATLLNNHSYKKHLNNTPASLFWINRPEKQTLPYGLLLEFGSKIAILDKSPNRSKLDLRGKPATYMGIDPSRKCIICLLPSGSFTHSRDFRILENDVTPNIPTPPIDSDDEQDIILPVQTSASLTPSIISESSVDSNHEPPVALENSDLGFDHYDVNLRETPTTSGSTPNDPTEDTNLAKLLVSEEPIVVNKEKVLPLGKGLFKAPNGSRCTFVDNSSYVPAQQFSTTNLPKKRLKPKTSKVSSRPPWNTSTTFFANAMVAIIDLPESTKKKNCLIQEARQREWNSLETTNTFEILDKSEAPKDASILPCRWVDGTKTAPNGDFMYKSRLVIGGHRQKHGVNFNEVFSPTLRATSLRLLISIAISKNWHLHHLDFVTAFLNAPIDTQIFMKLPLDYVDQSKVCLLKKSLYGLKQAPRLWYETLVTQLNSDGFQKLKSDHNIFARAPGTNRSLYIGIYVDDLLITGENLDEIKTYEQDLSSKFRMKLLGPVKTIVGIEVNRKEDYCGLSQSKLILSMLERFNLTDISPARSPSKISIKTADGTSLSANLAGTVLLGSILLKNVYLVKDLVANLISVQQLSKTYHVTFSPKGWTIAKDGQVVLKGSNANITPSSYFAPSSISLADAHRILGHIHSSSILMLASQNKLPFKLNSKTMPPCTSCILGKMDRSNKPTKALHRATKPGQRIVSDIWGPAPLPSHDNKRYFVHFTDEATGYVVKYNMEKKSEVLHHFRNFCNKMKTFAGFSIQCIRSDNGGEYLSNNFQNFCTNMGIHQEFTDNHSSFQNGLAERTNLTILNSVRTLLHGQSVSRKYWTEAADHATLLNNHSYKKHLNNTPASLFWINRPEKQTLPYGLLLEFGSKIAILDKSPNRSKLDLRGKPATYMGIDPSRKCIICLLPSGSFTHSRDFRILENDVTPNIPTPPIDSDDEQDIILPVQTSASLTPSIISESSVDSNHEPPVALENSDLGFDHYDVNLRETPTTSGSTPNDPTEDTNLAKLLVSEEPIVVNKEKVLPLGKGLFKAPNGSRCTFVDNSSYVPAQQFSTTNLPKKRLKPKTSKVSSRPPWNTSTTFFANAMVAIIDLPESTKKKNCLIQEARQREWNSLETTNTFEILDKSEAPKDASILPCRWVDGTKTAPNGDFMYKSRLVIGGHRQKHGVNFNEVFSPTLRATSLRLLISIAISKNWHLHHLDFVTAFLNAPIDTQIFMKLPLDYVDQSKVCLLKKSLYGLKQAPRLWYETLVTQLNSDGFQKLKSDHNIFARAPGTNRSLYIGIYVDDLLITGENLDEIKTYEQDLSSKFRMKLLGPVKTIVGIEVNRKEDYCGLSQSKLILSMLERFNLTDISPAKSPSKIMDNNEESPLLDSNQKYMEIIGTLIYLATNTRPEISYNVSTLAEKMQSPSEKDLKKLMEVVRYLKATYNHGLIYKQSMETNLIAYSDADYAADQETRKSRSGYLVFHSSNLVSWFSKKQQVVALSTCESEYVAACTAAQEMLWLKQLLQELNMAPNLSKLFVDNQGAISVAKNPKNHSKVKHIQIRYHFLREEVNSKNITLEYCKTTEMLADFLTKPLSAAKLTPLLKSIPIDLIM